MGRDSWGEGPAAEGDEHLYRRIVETVGAGIWAIDADQRTISINARLAERLGYRPEELVGRSAWELAFPEDAQLRERRWAERGCGQEDQAEFRLRHRDGTEVWFHAATCPLRDAEGRFAGAVGVFSDITERRPADQALRGSEQDARQLADSMPHIVWTGTGEGEVDYFNGRWYEYTGLSPEETLSAMGWRSAVHPDDLVRLQGLREPAVEGGQGFQADVRLRDRDGRYRWHIVRSVPVRDASGRVVRRFGTATDIDDRRRAEEASRASEQRFRFLAESIPHLVWTCRPDGVVDYASPRLREYLGIGPEDPLLPAWTEALHPEDRARALEAWERSLREGTEFHVEYRLRGADAEYRWFLGHALPQHDDAGRPAAWYGTCTDIDAQWRSRQEVVRLNRVLKARVDELEALFETIPIGVAIAEDRGCARIRANPTLERLLEAAPGSNASMSAPAGDRPEHYRFRRDGREVAPEDLPMQVAAGEGRPVIDATLEAVFDDGRTKLIHGNAAPLFDEDGRTRGAVGAFMDVTEWRRVEAALADSEEQLRLAVEATGLGLFDRDMRTGELRWSERTRAIFGLPPDEPITVDRFYSLVHPEDRDRIRAAVRRAADPEFDDDYDMEYRCVRDDGTVRWVHSMGRVLFEGRDVARRAARFVGAVQDITARKEAEAQLTDSKEAAETASLAKDKFLAALSHELRTPLAPVVAAVALMEMTPDLPPEVRDYLAMIRRNVALETRLIDDLLDLSRVISGKLRLDRRPAHLNDLVEHVMDMVGDEVHDKGLTLETTLGARPDLVDVDPARLQQVVWNLVKNAAKFTPSGGTIGVTTRSAGEGRVEVEVRDTGKGISPEALRSIFDPFEQGDPAITRQFGGLGLGLSIAKAVVDRHGGTIRAASDGPGKGSSFVVALPLVGPTADRPEQAAAPPVDGPGGRVRVLLVEDHVDTARATVRLLERSGYKVAWADGVAAALRLAASRTFDIVVSDLGLPDGNGYELMHQLRERHGLPGIALSGFGMEGDILRGREAGFLEHLVKPVDVDTLDQSIHRVARLARPNGAR
jgi:PAS domain S-box-containing protein